MPNKIGINLNVDEQIKKLYYSFYHEKIKLNEKTCFETGYINLNDIIFLPHGTYVELLFEKENNKYGKVIHYKYDMECKYATRYGTAIVKPNFDVNSDINFFELCKQNDIIMFINKNIYIDKHIDKFVQIIDKVPETEFIPVKIIYGNPNTKLFYSYGYYCTDDNFYYSDKNKNSTKINCVKAIYNPIIETAKEEELKQYGTNKEYKFIRNDIMIAPGEIELYIVYVILLGITFIFKDVIKAWVIFTIIMLIIRKKIKNQYHLK